MARTNPKQYQVVARPASGSYGWSPIETYGGNFERFYDRLSEAKAARNRFEKLHPNLETHIARVEAGGRGPSFSRKNPTFSLPKNKWVKASVMVTSGGKIRAKLSRKANASIRKTAKEYERIGRAADRLGLWPGARSEARSDTAEMRRAYRRKARATKIRRRKSR